jgi:hypothetical protein
MRAQRRARRSRAQADDQLWCDSPHLSSQPRPASVHVDDSWRLVQTPLGALHKMKVLHRVGEVAGRPVDPGFGESPVKQCSGRSHERRASYVLHVAGLLTDQ